jgi:cytidine deaminase
MTKQFSFKYGLFDDASELNPADKALLDKARTATETSYAPYSKFHVAAVALTASGNFVTGTNQENASYPAGICAERTLLSALSSIMPDEKIKTIAISYHNYNEGGHNNKPITPCGICRQSLVEYENRTGQKIRLIMSAMEGSVLVVESASQLLPFSFGDKDLK